MAKECPFQVGDRVRHSAEFFAVIRAKYIDPTSKEQGTVKEIRRHRGSWRNTYVVKVEWDGEPGQIRGSLSRYLTKASPQVKDGKN